MKMLDLQFLTAIWNDNIYIDISLDAYTMVRENLNFVQRISLTKNRYEVTSNKFTRDLSKELLVSLVASVFMGFGVVFLLLWVGIYV